MTEVCMKYMVNISGVILAIIFILTLGFTELPAQQTVEATFAVR